MTDGGGWLKNPGRPEPSNIHFPSLLLLYDHKLHTPTVEGIQQPRAKPGSLKKESYLCNIGQHILPVYVWPATQKGNIQTNALDTHSACSEYTNKYTRTTEERGHLASGRVSRISQRPITARCTRPAAKPCFCSV